MTTSEGARNFTGGGAAYDAFMGRYAVLLAPLMADLAGVTSGQRALDVGCGTGALTGELVRRLGVERVSGCDPAPAQLEACRARYPEVDLLQAPAEELPYPDASFDVALAQLVLHFTTDGDRSVAQMRRVVRTGGRVAACVWDFDGGMQMLRGFWDAVRAAGGEAPEQLLAMRYGRRGELPELLEGAGLADVSEHELSVQTTYEDFDELWSTLLMGIGPAGAHLVAQPEAQRQALRTAYHERLGRPEGTFSLGSLARAAVGTVP